MSGTLIRGRLRIFGDPVTVRHEDAGYEQARNVFVTLLHFPPDLGGTVISETPDSFENIDRIRLANDMATLRKVVQFLPWSVELQPSGEDWVSLAGTYARYSTKARGRFKSRYQGPARSPRRVRYRILQR